MRNLLSANIARARKDWTFRIILIFFIVSNFVILWGQYQEQLLYNVYHPLDQVLFYYGFWSGVTTAVFASLFIGTEYGDGTIRNKLIAGHKRVDIYLSNLITCIAVSFALCVLSMVELFVLGLPLMELGLKAPAQTVIITFVGELILVAAYCSIFTLISMVSSKKEISVVASILLAVVLILAAAYTYGRLSAPEFIKGYTITDAATGLQQAEQLPNPSFLRGKARAIFTFFNELNPMAQALTFWEMQLEHALRMMLYSVGIIAATTTAGLGIFCRKDIK